MSSNIIEIKNLIKKYGYKTAVDNISFTVEENSLFAFLGVNGAGKSTTINILSTLLKKTDGNVSVCGNYIDKNDEKIRADLGVVFQESLLDPLLTVKENVLFRGSLYGLSKKEIIKRLDYLAEAIDCKNFLNQRYGKLSGGQKRRADIVRALVNKPKILILDEPTTGLDPATRKKVWKTINDLKEKYNLTVFLTTHYMEEASIADKIVVISKGKIVAEGTPEDLRLNYSKDKLKVIYKEDNKQEILNFIKNHNLKYKEDRDIIYIYLNNSIESIDYLNNIKNYIIAFEVLRGNLDDAFINIDKESRQ